MKPVLRQILSTPTSSFLVRTDKGKNLVNAWHYHPEIELLFIKKSSGTWLIGDYIGHFGTGDVVMLGAGLPHCFRHDKEYTSGGKTVGETICVKFIPDIFGETFLSLPETRLIRDTFSTCRCGIKLKGRLREKVSELIQKMATETPGKKLAHLLYLLQEIAEHKEYSPFASKAFLPIHDDIDRARIKLVYEYTLTHYSQRITIGRMASLLNMARQSFCRYFKSKTNKSYMAFLIEVRIGAACRLLVEDEKNVSEICYECGYSNISHFNHQFRKVTRKRPLQYKYDYLQKQ